MKKFSLLMMALSVFFLASCSKNNESAKRVLPTDVITAEQVSQTVGSYSLSLDGNSVVDMGSNTYKAVFLSNPVGSNPSVTVEITSPGTSLSEQNIEASYEESYEKRAGKQRVQGIGDKAFVAFPYVLFLQDGYKVKISAGEGDTQEQLDLLISLGKLVSENLQNYLDTQTNGGR